MNPVDLRELLPAVILGVATPEERALVQTALESDPELRREAQELKLALIGLAAVEAKPAPVGLKTKLLEQARREGPSSATGVSVALPTDSSPIPATPSQPSDPRANVIPLPAPRRNPVIAWLGGAVALAAAVAGLLVLNRPAGITVDAAVVANTRDGGLLYANSGSSSAPIVLVDSGGTRRNVSFKLPKPAYFTRAITAGNLSYVLDAMNAKVFIVNLDSGEMVDEWPVPEGASGLDVQGDTVIVKGASSGTLLTFRQNGLGDKTMVEARVSTPNPNMPLEDIMDAAVIADGQAYVTHHATGTVAVVNLETNRERARYPVGQKPVSLAVDGTNLLVLDVAGKLFKLERNTGKTVLERALEGTPDRLTLAPNRVAYLSDRAGFVTAVNADSLEIIARKKFDAKLMDLTPMPDGHIAVAAANKGVLILDDRLEMVKTF